MKLVENFYCIGVARLICGFCAGVLNITIGKILNDTIPVEVVQWYSIATNSGISFGLMSITIISANIIPV